MNDKDILGSVLTDLKHTSHCYHSLGEQTGNVGFLKEVCSILQEKEEQRIRVFQAMNQRGWYNPQLINNEQLQQAKSKATSTQQQMQQTVSNSVGTTHSGAWSNQWPNQPTSSGATTFQGTGNQPQQHQPTWG